MKIILPRNAASIRVAIDTDKIEKSSYKTQTEEIILYDECGDTQWDKVLAQYDLADQLSKDTKNK